MSRGFIKEGDQEEIPLVPPRAFLPEGEINYVTWVGLNELLAEKEKLVSERENLNIVNENEKRIAVNHINAKLFLLDNRIDTAVIVNLEEQPQNEVRFGASVTLRIEEANRIKTFQIVGVDEADVSKGKISFVSPLARELTNKKIGEKVIIKRDNKSFVYEILNIAYK
ncbi:MAG: GreA/GreB family elongation factor [Fermentimonas sp.]|nr:GreA/GreB family elongation factor [Fermentimonas sp.]